MAQKSRRETGSTPLEGSSRNRISGRCSRVHMRPSFCFMPPESLPALLALPMLLILKEPQAWVKAKAEAVTGGSAKAVGSIAGLFRQPRWRRSTLVGICLGVAGMVGLWGIAFFSPELITTAFKNRPLQMEEVLRPAELCAALKSPANPGIAHLKARLSPRVVKQLDAVERGKEPPAATVEALVADLNRTIQQDNLHDEAAFQSVNLKKRTKNLIQLVQIG